MVAELDVDLGGKEGDPCEAPDETTIDEWMRIWFPLSHRHVERVQRWMEQEFVSRLVWPQLDLGAI